MALLIALFIVGIGATALKVYYSSYILQEEKFAEAKRKSFFLFLFFKQLQNIPQNVFGYPPIFEGDEKKLKFVSNVPLLGRYFPGIFGIELRIKEGKLLEANIPLVDVEDYRNFLNEDLKKEWFLVFFFSGEECHFEYSDGKIWKRSWKKGIPKFIALKSSKESYIFPVMFFSSG
ncbi:hypothetical protein [Desulfurobacterium sp.]|uniref:hypothetical protein n=1 Tax=Desulfurobacterium sp. TaxID=2004706 RepID=UPI0031B85D25